MNALDSDVAKCNYLIYNDQLTNGNQIVGAILLNQFKFGLYNSVSG